MQNLVVLMEPEDADKVSLKAGNMILNRFCINEDTAFELSGVNYLKVASNDMTYEGSLELKVKREEKGKEYNTRRIPETEFILIDYKL